MRVGLITPHYLPESGDLVDMVRAQASALRDLGHEVRILSGCEWELRENEVVHGRVDDLPVAYFPRTREESFLLSMHRPRLTKRMLEELKGAEVCLVHSGDSLTQDIVRQVSRRMPVLVYLHDFVADCPRATRQPANDVEACPSGDADTTCATCLEEESGGMAHELLTARLGERRREFRAELAAADRLLAPTVQLAEKTERLFGRAPGSIEVLHPGLSRKIPPMHAAQRRAPWDGRRPLSILCFGSRGPESGLLDVVLALRQLPRNTFELVITGAEGDARYEAQLAQASLGLPVHFFGPYRTTQLATVASACDLAAFPAHSPPGRAQAVEEALALGLPVWCTDEADGARWIARDETRNAHVDALGSPGRILPTGDPAAWTRALESLLRAPERLTEERKAIPEAFETAADAARELGQHFEDLLAHTVRQAS